MSVLNEVRALQVAGTTHCEEWRYHQAVETYTDAIAMLKRTSNGFMGGVGGRSADEAPSTNKTKAVSEGDGEECAFLLAALLSDRSAAHLQSGNTDAALVDADACIAAASSMDSLSSLQAKGYLAKVAVLHAQGDVKGAIGVCELAVKVFSSSSVDGSSLEPSTAGPPAAAAALEEVSQKLEQLRKYASSSSPSDSNKKKKSSAKAKLPLVCGDGAPRGRVAAKSRDGQRVTRRLPCLFRAFANAGGAVDPATGLGNPSLYPSSPRWAEESIAFIKASMADRDFPLRSIDLKTPAGVEEFSRMVEVTAYHFQCQRHSDLALFRLESNYHGLHDTPMTIAEHVAIGSKSHDIILSDRLKAEIPTTTTTTTTTTTSAAAAAAATSGEAGSATTNTSTTAAAKKYTRAQLLSDEALKGEYTEQVKGLHTASGSIEPRQLNLKIDFTVRCDWCAAVIDMPDPPMCECGEFFCSEECHECDYQNTDAKKEVVSGRGTVGCRHARLAAKRTGVSHYNRMYWKYCATGLLRWPHDELKNYSLVWRADARYSSPKSPYYMPELDFLMERERMALAEQIGRRQEEVQKYAPPATATATAAPDGGDSSPPSSQSTDAVAAVDDEDKERQRAAAFRRAHRDMGFTTLLQYVRMSDYQPQYDSVARMQFKVLMLSTIWANLGHMRAQALAPEPLNRVLAKFQQSLKGIPAPDLTKFQQKPNF